MKCPNCGFEESKVIDTRPADNHSIRRRRVCINCKKRFTTFEIIESTPIFVIKKDGNKEFFDRNKLLAGMLKACYKRPVTTVQLMEAIDQIEMEMQNSLRNEYTSTELGEFAMEKLKELDEVSYVRFASVYREFKDVETFMSELKELMKKSKKKGSKSKK